MKNRLICGICLVALLVTLAGCGISAGVTTAPTPTPDSTPEPTPEPLPQLSFSTVDSDGNAWTEASLADTKLTMINLWAYWCGPCLRELPDLQQLSVNYANRGLRVLGIGDPAEESANLAVMKDNGVEYPCLRYTEEFDPWLNTGYVPTTMFVDAEGQVRGEVVVGSRGYEEWAEIVDSLLAEIG